MIRLIVFCCLGALAVGANLPLRNGRIVDGTEAIEGQFPYQVSLRSTNNRHFCGGFIISSRWIGSATHCTIYETPSRMIAVVGALFLTTGGLVHRVSKIINHPDHDVNN